MSSEAFQITFDCSNCDKRISVSENMTGQTIYCPHCVRQIQVPGKLSADEKLLAGLADIDEPEHPGALKIDGISSSKDDGTSWHIKCHICDSVLLVTKAQVGSQVKCNDCFTMLDVKPNKELPDVDAGATVVGEAEQLEVPASSFVDESDELTLLPPVELPQEFKSAQKEILIDDVIDEPLTAVEDAATEIVATLDEIPDEPLVLTDHPKATTPTTDEAFDLQASSNANAGSPSDDSDEEIEIINISPEVANQQLAASREATVQAQTLPRIPRSGKQQPKAIPVGDDVDAPIRVHAKKRKRRPNSFPRANEQRYDFESNEIGDILDKAIGMLKTGNLILWALGCTLLMSMGSGIWHSLSANDGAANNAGNGSLKGELLSWLMGWLFGQSFFFLGYVLLLFVGGVIFRETAMGKVKIDPKPVSERTSFFDTLMLFGFSMFVAAIPMAYVWQPFIVLPVQLLLAGIFLLPAWKNQNAFNIIPTDIVDSFRFASSWKKWLAITSIAVAGCVIGGLLLQVPWPIISIVTSALGSFVIVMSTMLYAAASGWHCGGVAERMEAIENNV